MNHCSKKSITHIKKINSLTLVVLLFTFLTKVYGAENCFKWIEWDWNTLNQSGFTLKGKTANSPVNNVTYSSSSTILVSPMTGTGAGVGLFNYSKFKSNYDSSNIKVQYGEFPSNRQVIKNVDATTNTLTFDTPVNNPILIFASVGSGIVPVTVKFARQIDIVYAGNEQGSQTSFCTSSACGVSSVIENGKVVGFTGKEGYVIMKIPGENITSVTFSYTAENWVNFLFGYIPSTCGDGSLECGEQCDLGKRNGIEGLGCSDICKATSGFECSGFDNLTSWAKIFNDRIQGLASSCFTDAGCTISDETSGGVVTTPSTQVIESIQSQSIHLIAQNISASACSGGGKEGKYAKLVLKDLRGITQQVVIKCTNEKIDLLDMQSLRKKTARVYTQIADKKCGAGSTAMTTLDLDGSLQDCQLFCDDNKNCKFAVETTVGAAKKCNLYSSCTQESATGAKIFQFNG